MTDIDKKSLQYRLIGAAVIIVFCSLAWWGLLDHDVKRYQDLATNIPPEIEFEHFDLNEAVNKPVQTPSQSSPQEASAEQSPVKPAPKADVKTVPVAKPLAAKPTPKPQPAVKPSKAFQKEKQKLDDVRLSDKGFVEAWVLQVGAFKEKKNAEALRLKLLKSDIRAYVKRFSLPSGTVFRVLIGPKLSKTAAQSMQSTVRKRSGLEPMLVKFKPGYEQ